MRLFTSTLATETNTLVGFPTGLGDFERCQLVHGSIAGQPPGLWTTPALTWLERAARRGWQVREGLHAYAEPGGVVVRSAYEAMRAEILAALDAAMPVDAVLLGLHGAMVADGYDDCEGDLVGHVRARIGPAVPIGVELDLHCHLTPELVGAASFIVIYRTYPHIDYGERAHELFDILERVLDKGTRPVMAVVDCRSMGLFPTTRGTAMPAFMEGLEAVIGRPGILGASLAHGFPWADVPVTGVKALAVADGDASLAQATAERLAHAFLAVRAEAALAFVPMADAIARAAASTATLPVLLADTADQTGGGAPGDSTFLLDALLRHGIEGAALAALYDPGAVWLAFQAGIGARATLRIGGKLDRFSGPPLDLAVEVLGLWPNASQEGLNGEEVPMGDAALLRTGGVDVLLTSVRSNIYTPSALTRHGIDIGKQRVIAIKALYRYWDLFAPRCSEMMLLATPGACGPDWGTLPLKRIPRPMWPLDGERA